MEKDWIKVYGSPDQAGTWIIRSALENEGIRVVILDKTSSPYGNFVAGEVEIYVHTDDAAAALDLIYSLESGE